MAISLGRSAVVATGLARDESTTLAARLDVRSASLTLCIYPTTSHALITT